MAITLPFPGDTLTDTTRFQPRESDSPSHRGASERSLRETRTARETREQDDDAERKEKKVQRRTSGEDFETMMGTLLVAHTGREETWSETAAEQKVDTPSLVNSLKATTGVTGDASSIPGNVTGAGNTALAGTGTEGSERLSEQAALQSATLQNQIQNTEGLLLENSNSGSGTGIGGIESAIQGTQPSDAASSENNVSSERSGELNLPVRRETSAASFGSSSASSGEMSVYLSEQPSVPLSAEILAGPFASESTLVTQALDTTFRTQAELDLTGQTEAGDARLITSADDTSRSESTSRPRTATSTASSSSGSQSTLGTSGIRVPDSGAVGGEIRIEPMQGIAVQEAPSSGLSREFRAVEMGESQQFGLEHGSTRSGSGEQRRGFGVTDSVEPIAARGAVSTGVQGALTGLTSTSAVGVSPGFESGATFSSQLRQPLSAQVSTAILEYVEREGVAGDKTLTVRLDPPELGEMVIEMSKSEDGLAVRVTAREAVTMEMLLSRGSEIEQHLRSEKLDLTSLEFLSSGSMNERSSQRDPSESARGLVESTPGRSGRRSGTSGSGNGGGSTPAVKDSHRALTFRA